MEILRVINYWFWNEDLWLPRNTTWNDLSDTSTMNYAKLSDLLNGFKVALVLLISRFILENYVFPSVGKYLGKKLNVNGKVNKDITENKILEKAFRESERFDHKKVQNLSKQLDWTERRIERWVRRRISRRRKTDLLIDIVWEHTLHACGVCYGLYALWDKPWFWDTKYFWYEYPHHSVTDDIWWYYMLQLGCFGALSVYKIVNTKRKSFLQMLVHHMLSIITLVFSWRSNLFRIGSFVAFILEMHHVPLLAAKIAKYVKYQRVTVAFSLVFAAVWVIIRLVIYPYKVMYSAMYEYLLFQQRCPGYYLANSFLCAVQVVNIYWSWIIIKKTLHVISSGKPGLICLRSDSEENSSSSNENESGFKGTSSQDRQTVSCLQHKGEK